MDTHTNTQFHCCGFDSNDGTAYKGPTSFPQNGTNQCSAQDISGIAGCHDQSYQFFTRTAIFFGIFLIIVVIFSAVTLHAANEYRQKAVRLQRGRLQMANSSRRYQVDPFANVKGPLMQGYNSPQNPMPSTSPSYRATDAKSPLMHTTV
eukprot:jgi/Hompol1/1894/HPOL_005776-RA